MTDELLERIRRVDPIDPADLDVPAPPTITAPDTRRPVRRWPRALPAVAAAAVAAGAVAGISFATGDDPAPRPDAPVVSPGRAFADRLAGSRPVGVAAAHLDASIIEVLATGGYGVDAGRTWRLPVPGSTRPAWLFAGDRKLAVVVPRISRTPDGRRLRGAASIWGSTLTDARRHGIAGTQSGGGQPARVVLLLPPGAPAPSLVRRGTTTPLRPLRRLGNVYTAQPRAGEAVNAPSLPNGRRQLVPPTG